MALLEFHNTLITGIDTMPAQLLMTESMTGTMLELDVLRVLEQSFTTDNKTEQNL